jgi:predicted enzyme related to lactoylglutathione lyase
LIDAAISATAFLTEDIQAEFARLKERGVKFHGEARSMRPIISIVFEDSCGNLISLVQPLL